MGRMTKSPRHGWAVFAAMGILFVAGVTTAYWAEARGNPLMHGVAQQTTETQAGGNMEGKEVRLELPTRRCSRPQRPMQVVAR